MVRTKIINYNFIKEIIEDEILDEIEYYDLKKVVFL